MKKITCAALAGFLLAAGCGKGDEEKETPPAPPVVQDSAADLPYAAEPNLTPEELERGRLDSDWASVVTVDTTGGGVPVNNPEKWEQISAQQLNRTPIFLPLSGDVAGPSVLRVQILLDRAFFSPGIMDGRWGKNTAKALYFFQQREGLRTTGRADSATFNRLARVAGAPDQLVVQKRLTADEVEGPFMAMPDSIYAQAELPCSCYQSLSEKLSEIFHATPELLGKLNPGVDLDSMAAGQAIWVPNVRSPDARPVAAVAQLAVSGRGSYVHALDANGRILYHFPSTLGSTYDPSPSGSFTVRRVTKDPVWHLQPELLASVPDWKPDARIPAGPNNRVGLVWMALSAPHYGIHGTDKPETIGYATSSGCVRLTNWDALFLADRIRPGTPVRFRDITGRSGGGREVGGATGRRPAGTAPAATATRTTPARPATRAPEPAKADTGESHEGHDMDHDSASGRA